MICIHQTGADANTAQMQPVSSSDIRHLEN